MADIAWLKIHSSFDDQQAGTVSGPIELTDRVQAIIAMGYASILELETAPVASKTRTRRKAVAPDGQPAGTESGTGEAGTDAGGPASGETDDGEDPR